MAPMPEDTQPKFLRNFYLACFFLDFVFAYAIYNVFFSIRGLSILKISLLLGWWAFAVLVFEIPTGALADRWSRRNMLVLAPLIKAGCFVTWFFARGDFVLYGLGFLLWGLSEAFASGTTQALLYDHLKLAGKTGDYEKVLGRKTSFSHLALALSLVSGGFIASRSLDWAILLSTVPLFFSAFFAAGIREAPKAQANGRTRYMEFIRVAWREVRSNRVLPYLFACFGVIFITFGTLDEFDQLYYQLVRLPLYAFGIAGFAWSMLNAAGAQAAYKFKDRPWVFFAFPLLSALCLFAVALYPSIPVIAVLWLAYFLAAPLQVLVEGRIQRHIRSESRATITSFNSFFLNLSAVILIPILGLIGRIAGLRTIYLSVGLILLLFSAWVFRVRNKPAVKAANIAGDPGDGR